MEVLCQKEILRIFTFLTTHDVLILARVSKKFNEISASPPLWNDNLTIFFPKAVKIPEKSHFKGIIHSNFYKVAYFTAYFFNRCYTIRKKESDQGYEILKTKTFRKKLLHFDLFEIQFLDDSERFEFIFLDETNHEYKVKLIPEVYAKENEPISLEEEVEGERTEDEEFVTEITFKKNDHLSVVSDRKSQNVQLFVNGKVSGIVSSVKGKVLHWMETSHSSISPVRLVHHNYRLNFWKTFVPLITRDLEEFTMTQTLQIQKIRAEHIQKIRILGRSAYGTAFLCKWLEEGSGITVVGKEYLIDVPIDIIRKEIGYYQSFDFPLVRRIYGYAKYKRCYLVIMEHMEDSLYQLYKREGPYIPKRLQKQPIESDPIFDRLGKAEPPKGLSFRDRYELIVKMVQGLNHLHKHRKGLVHKNIKSGNFLVSKDRSLVKICDFSMVQQRRISTLFNARWSAPEVLRSPPRFSRYSDIYALGMTIYELLIFNIPFHTITSDEEVKRLVLEEKKMPNEWPDDAPSIFRELVEMCLSQDPKKRPTSGFLLRFLKKNESKFCVSEDNLEEEDGEKENGGGEKKINYEIISQVGKGGFGSVFKAINKDTGEIIAIKRIVNFGAVPRTPGTPQGSSIFPDTVTSPTSRTPTSCQIYTTDSPTEDLTPGSTTLGDAEIEISFLKNLKHKHIVKYLGSERSSSGNTFLIFLEFANEGSLDRFFEKNFESLKAKGEGMPDISQAHTSRIGVLTF